MPWGAAVILSHSTGGGYDQGLMLARAMSSASLWLATLPRFNRNASSVTGISSCISSNEGNIWLKRLGSLFAAHRSNYHFAGHHGVALAEAQYARSIRVMNKQQAGFISRRAKPLHWGIVIGTHTGIESGTLSCYKTIGAIGMLTMSGSGIIFAWLVVCCKTITTRVSYL